LNDRVVQRSNRIALAGNFRSDPLENLRRQARVDQNRELRLSEHVDKARRDDLAARVNRALARCGRQIANGRDLPVANAYICGVPGGPGSVDNVTASDDEIEGSRRLGR
jgi:hypothetical protein